MRLDLTAIEQARPAFHRVAALNGSGLGARRIVMAPKDIQIPKDPEGPKGPKFLKVSSRLHVGLSLAFIQ